MLELGRQVLGVGDVLEGPREQLLAGVADDPAVRLVDAEEAAVGVLVGDAHGGVFERAAEPLLALAQRLLGPHPLGDVLCQGDDADESAVRVHEWGVEPLAGDDPAVLGPVLVDTAGVHVPGPDAPENVLQLVTNRERDDHVEGHLAHHFFLGVAEYLLRSGIPIQHAVIRVEQDIRQWQPLDLKAELPQQAVPLDLGDPACPPLRRLP